MYSKWWGIRKWLGYSVGFLMQKYRRIFTMDGKLIPKVWTSCGDDTKLCLGTCNKRPHLPGVMGQLEQPCCSRKQMLGRGVCFRLKGDLWITWGMVWLQKISHVLCVVSSPPEGLGQYLLRHYTGPALRLDLPDFLVLDQELNLHAWLVPFFSLSFLFCLWDRVLMCSPGCPQTYNRSAFFCCLSTGIKGMPLFLAFHPFLDLLEIRTSHHHTGLSQSRHGLLFVVR